MSGGVYVGNMFDLNNEELNNLINNTPCLNQTSRNDLVIELSKRFMIQKINFYSFFTNFHQK